MLHGDQVQHNVSQYLDPANATWGPSSTQRVTVPRPCKCYTETKFNTLCHSTLTLQMLHGDQVQHTVSQYLDPANATRGPSSTHCVTVPRPCKCYTETKFNTTCHSTSTLQMLHGDQVQHTVSQYLDPANATRGPSSTCIQYLGLQMLPRGPSLTAVQYATLRYYGTKFNTLCHSTSTYKCNHGTSSTHCIRSTSTLLPRRPSSLYCITVPRPCDTTTE
ncbi:hypothetical protein STEG23_011892 [Scotinomys teguina]